VKASLSNPQINKSFGVDNISSHKPTLTSTLDTAISRTGKYIISPLFGNVPTLLG
jgi:hypothetical protein